MKNDSLLSLNFLVQLVRLNLGPPCGVDELPVKPYHLIAGIIFSDIINDLYIILGLISILH
jgi:hypothetical protein